MPMGRGCNMPRQACCVDTIQQVAWHESGPLRCESNNSLPGRLSLQQKPTCPGTNEAQQPAPVADNNSYVVRWSVCSNHEDALPQV
mgnify:CR=1 FL=1